MLRENKRYVKIYVLCTTYGHTVIQHNMFNDIQSMGSGNLERDTPEPTDAQAAHPPGPTPARYPSVASGRRMDTGPASARADMPPGWLGGR